MWKQKIGLALFSTFFTILLLAIIGQFVKVGGESLNRKIVLKAWFTKERWFGTSEIGIFQPDSVLGWSLKPRSSGKSFIPYGFRVTYNIDEEGHRVTPGSYDGPKVLLLGCSFTFGHGVEDNEAYPALLANKLTHYKVINAAAPAWGTQQAYLQLEKSLNTYSDVRLVVYGFINHHLQRNQLRKAWLEQIGLGRKNPHLDVVDGELKHLGLADADRDGLTDEDSLDQKEREITLALLNAMQALCDEHQIPFLVVNLPEEWDTDFRDEISGIVGPNRFLDLRGDIDFKSLQLPVDGHPNAECHRQIADLVTPFLWGYLDTAMLEPKMGFSF